MKSILLVLEYMDGEGSAEPATTELKVGAIQTAQFASKKVKKIRSAALCQTPQGVLTEYHWLLVLSVKKSLSKLKNTAFRVSDKLHRIKASLFENTIFFRG